MSKDIIVGKPFDIKKLNIVRHTSVNWKSILDTIPIGKAVEITKSYHSARWGIIQLVKAEEIKEDEYAVIQRAIRDKEGKVTKKSKIYIVHNDLNGGV